MSIDFKSINRHRGDFTKKARAAGMGVQEYAGHVLANTGNYDTRTVRQASFAKAAKKFKHAFGGSLNIYAGDDLRGNSSGQYFYNFPDRTEIIPPYRLETNFYADPRVNKLKLDDGRALNDSFMDYYASNNRPMGFGDMKDIELSRRLAGGEYGVREGMRNKITGNVKPGTVPEPYDNSGSLAEYATRHGMIDYGDGVGSDGLLMQHWNSFNVDRAKSVWSHLKARGLTDGQAAALVAALYDESPLGPEQYEWTNETTGSGKNKRTVQAYGALHFTDDSKWGAEWATRFKDWLEKNKRENDAESAVDFWLDEYLPAQERKYREKWADANISGREMSDLMFRDLQRGKNANDSDFLARKGEIYDMILDAATADAAQRAEVEGYNPNTIWNGPADVPPEYFAAGGELAHSHGAWWPNGLQFVNAGGTHEQNPNMGVQVGVDGEGTPNLVEEGEVIYGDYVFSNRLYPTRRELEEANLPVSYAKKTFAYIAERMGRESEERPNDAISRRGLEAMLRRLAGIQERQRRERGLVGTQQMEQGAGMMEGPGGIPQGMTPEDMIAMQGGGEVPPEMLAQAAGAGVAQPEGYAPEGAGEAPEGYGGEGYLSAYGGRLPNEYGGDRNIRRFAKDLADKMPLFSEAELDDKGRRVLGDGVSQKDSDLYYSKFGKKYNRLLTRAVRHAKSNPEVLYSKAMAAEQGGGAPVKPQNENMLHVANENRKLKNDVRVDDVEHPILDPSEVYGGRLRYSYVLGLIDPTKGDGETKEIRGRRLTKKVAKADAVRAYEDKVREIADRGEYAEPFLGLTYAGQGKGTIRRQLDRKGYLMPYTKAYGGNIYSALENTKNVLPLYPNLPPKGEFDENYPYADYYTVQAIRKHNSIAQNIEKEKEKGKPHLLPTNMRYASAMGPAVSALVNAFRRPDNSEAKAYESIAANVPNVSVRPRMLGNYMAYSPLSREFALNTVRAQAGATRRANVGRNAGQANALNLALNYQAVPQMGQALAQTDAQNLERMRAVQEFNRGTDAYNAQYDMTAQQQNAQNALQRYNLVSTLRSNAAKARSQERADLEEARTQSLAGVFSNIGAIGKENFAYNQMLGSYGQYKSTPNGGVLINGKEYVPVQTACGGMLTRRKTSRKGEVSHAW